MLIHPKAEVIAVGYPQIVPARGTCLTLLPIAAGFLLLVGIATSAVLYWWYASTGGTL